MLTKAMKAVELTEVDDRGGLLKVYLANALAGGLTLTDTLLVIQIVAWLLTAAYTFFRLYRLARRHFKGEPPTRPDHED